MGKMSGKTRSASSSVNKYSEEESAKYIKSANIHTTNIFDVEDNFTSQQKVELIMRANRMLKDNGLDGVEVRSLSIEDDGRLTVGSLVYPITKSSNSLLNTYAYISRPRGFMHDYFDVEYEGVKFRTTDLSTLRQQASYVLNKKYTGRIDGAMEEKIDPLTDVVRKNVRKKLDVISTVESLSVSPKK